MGQGSGPPRFKIKTCISTGNLQGKARSKAFIERNGKFKFALVPTAVYYLFLQLPQFI